jgi:hypothetical protein
MPSESAKLFRTISFEYEAPGGAVAQFTTDLPGDTMVVRASITLPASTGRRVFSYHFVGGVKGRIIRLRVTPSFSSTAVLYSAKVYARRTGPTASDWAWVPLNVAPNQEWVKVQLPIPPTPDGYTPVRLAIPPTPDAFTPLRLPVEPTAAQRTWYELPMDR